MSCLSLTQNQNTSVQLQHVITSKVSNSLTLVKSGQNVWTDLGPNCLKGLSADDNVMLRFKAKLYTLVQLQVVITSKVSNSFDPNQVRTECQA